MLLESLSNSNINIQSLTISVPKPEALSYNPREHYEALKESALYDKKKNQWLRTMYNFRELEERDRASYDQLLGVLVEAHFDRTRAQQLYEELKSSPFYDSESKQWVLVLTPSQRVINQSRITLAQLLGVLVEAEFDLPAAEKLFQKLKKTPAFYNKKKELWGYGLNGLLKNEDHGHSVFNQLLGVLVETKFNPEYARELYSKVKTSDIGDDLSTFTNLLNILVEAEFNADLAHLLYAKLKAGPLYHPKHMLWLEISGDRTATADFQTTISQLFGVLVETKLSRLLSIPITETPPLPDMRRF